MAPLLLSAALGAIAVAFRNPVVDVNAPDPGVAKIGDTWYMVTTGGDRDTGAFEIRTSPDLVSWSLAGRVFASGAVPAWTSKDYWAPELHKVNDKYHVYYTARETGGRMGIGVAAADAPLGPYEDLGQPLIISGLAIGDAGGSIDGHFFRDDDGRHYFFWKENQMPPLTKASIKMRELDASGMAWAAGSQERTLFHPELPWEGDCVEAPWMVKRNGEYFLFYSAETTFATKYAVGVARAPTPEGPFTKSCAPVLSQFASDASVSVRPFATTGHCSVVETSQGPTMVYHAYRSDGIGGDRVVLVDRIQWTAGGWPRVGSCGSPTVGEQPLPEEPFPAVACLEEGQVYQMNWADEAAPMTTPGGSLFRVVQGNCPGGTVSFEAADKAEHFARHKSGKLRLDASDGSGLFAQDSSFLVQPGLVAGDLSTVSLRPANYPYEYVSDSGGTVVISAFSEGAEFQDAATWQPQRAAAMEVV